jgi:hypothetical protein
LISIAAFGDIESGVTIERVDVRIQQHFGAQRKVTAASRPLPPPDSPGQVEDAVVENTDVNAGAARPGNR